VGWGFGETLVVPSSNSVPTAQAVDRRSYHLGAKVA